VIGLHRQQVREGDHEAEEHERSAKRVAHETRT
jgi:hypothetical protein